FNKRLEDFGGSLKKYNDYLEEVEDILFNLINDVDVQQTYERIEKFRQENKDIIATNLSKQMNEEKAIAYRLEKEKKEKQLRKEAYLAQIKEDEKWKAVEKEEILRQLASSEKSAKDIIAETIAKRPQHSAHLLDLPGMQDDYIEDGDTQWGDYGDFDPMDHIYEDLHTLNVLDSYNDPWTTHLRTDKKARAGGYLPKFTQSRALSAAYSGVFIGV
ncbi:TFIIH/NER complex subunit, partial [Quaeritorhiza haematococci]